MVIFCDERCRKRRFEPLFSRRAVFRVGVGVGVGVGCFSGDIEKEEADKLGLVPSHAYAVLDAKEVNGTRLLQVLYAYTMVGV